MDGFTRELVRRVRAGAAVASAAMRPPTEVIEQVIAAVSTENGTEDIKSPTLSRPKVEDLAIGRSPVCSVNSFTSLVGPRGGLGGVSAAFYTHTRCGTRIRRTVGV